jgi:hypothetical protein
MPSIKGFGMAGVKKKTLTQYRYTRRLLDDLGVEYTTCEYPVGQLSIDIPAQQDKNRYTAMKFTKRGEFISIGVWHY